MTRNRFVFLLLLALGSPVAGAAGTLAPDDRVSTYQRFLIYPHLDRGFQALKRRDYQAAIAAFERARIHAPRNVETALFLADAYRRGGQPARADRVLAEQRGFTPADPRLRGRAPATPVSGCSTDPSACSAGRSATVRSGMAIVPEVQAITAPPPLRKPAPRHVTAPTVSVEGELARALAHDDIARAASLLNGEPVSSYPEARLTVAARRGRNAEALRIARRLVAAAPRDGELLDRASFRLTEAGAGDQAARLLLDAFPFPRPQRELLLGRLELLLSQAPQRASLADRAQLRTAAIDVATRNFATHALAATADCDALQALATDPSADLPDEAWVRLGTCVPTSDSSLAGQSFEAIARRRGGDQAMRALAYRADARHDFAGALRAWAAIPVDRLDPDQLLAAATAGVAAEDSVRATAWLDEFTTRSAPQSAAFWWLRARSSTPGSAAERASIDRAISLHDDARYESRLAQLQRAAGETDAAIASLERAHSLAPADAVTEAALGYAYLAAGEHRGALKHLAPYQLLHPEDADVAENLAEVQRKLVHPTQAMEMSEVAINDLLVVSPPDADRLFRLRRLHEQLGRQWSFSVDATLGTAVAGTGSTIPGATYRSYAQVEADYRLGDHIGRPDADALAVYARTFAGAAAGGIVPNDLPTLGVGVRWKPFETRILYVALERQLALDRRETRQDDTLVRLSAAPLTDPAISNDWHASGTGWWSHTIYLDAAHYLQRGNSALTADYQVGRHFKTGEGSTLEPFARLQLNGLWQQGRLDRDSRVGLGMRWNRWWGATRYDAYPHRVVAGAEVQQALSTYLPERRSFFINIGSYW